MTPCSRQSERGGSAVAVPAHPEVWLLDRRHHRSVGVLRRAGHRPEGRPGRRAGRHARQKGWFFVAGVVLLWLASATGRCTTSASSYLYSAHMVQHLLISFVRRAAVPAGDAAVAGRSRARSTTARVDVRSGGSTRPVPAAVHLQRGDRSSCTGQASVNRSVESGPVPLLDARAAVLRGAADVDAGLRADAEERRLIAAGADDLPVPAVGRPDRPRRVG